MIFLRMNKSSLISTADDTIHIIFYNIILYNTDNDSGFSYSVRDLVLLSVSSVSAK